MKIMVADTCEHISSFASRMVAAAYVTNGTVLGEFNQHTLEARPGHLTADIVRQWEAEQRKNDRR